MNDHTTAEQDTTFDIPEFAMSYEEEADLEGEPESSRSGQVCEVETVVSIWRAYLLDPIAWDFAPAKARIEDLIASRSAAVTASRATRIERGRARYHAMARDDIASIMNIHPRGGSFGEDIARLVGRGLATSDRGRVRARDFIMAGRQV